MNTTHRGTEQVAAHDWSGVMGERWLAHLSAFEGMIAPIGEALMQHAGFASGERVIDVGCGAGGTSIDIARRVAPSGAVLGLDISAVLVDAARRRARDAQSQGLEFLCADAATVRLQGEPSDRLFSRFGLMFFEQPVQAFANLRQLLRRGARADFAVWAPPTDNAWVAEVMAILAQHVELPAPVPHAPGPFALDDPAYLNDVLRGAGFRPATIEIWEGPQLVGGAGATPREATDFLFGAMHFADLLEQAGPDAHEKVRDELSNLFARHRTDEGIAMAGKAYLVTTSA